MDSTPHPADPAATVPGFVEYTPDPRRVRHDGWTLSRQHAFIDMLAVCANVSEAARAAGMDRRSAYYLKKRSPSFAEAWEEALDEGLEGLVEAAMARALHGVIEPVFHKGEQVGERRRYNDRLLMFLLRCRRPATFGNHPPAPAAATPEETPYDYFATANLRDDLMTKIRTLQAAREGTEGEDGDAPPPHGIPRANPHSSQRTG